MKKKEKPTALIRYDTYEETLKNAKRYINKVANKFNMEEHFPDLVQAGYIGLWSAYNKYDESRGAFHAAALIYIRKEMLVYINDNIHTIRYPHYQHNENCATHLKKFPKPGDYQMISTSSEDRNNNDLTTVADNLESESFETWDGYQLEFEDPLEDFKIQLRHYLPQLNERYQQVIKMRYEEHMKLKEIGEVLGLTRERVRQIETKAIIELKKMFKQ